MRECMLLLQIGGHMIRKEPKTLQELNLVDRFLFDELMDVPGAYEMVLTILLENKVSLLDKVQTEKEFRVSPALRSVRMDYIDILFMVFAKSVLI